MIREGMGQATGVKDEDALDLVITNALVLDYTGIYKADIGVKHGKICGEYCDMLHKMTRVKSICSGNNSWHNIYLAYHCLIHSKYYLQLTLIITMHVI